MHEEQPFTWFGQIPGLEHVESHVITAIFVAVTLVICGSIAALLMKSAKNPMVPEDRVTFRNIFEIAAEKLYRFCEDILGHHGAQEFFPIVATLFLFIFASNAIGLIPGFLPPTENINTTFATAVFVFIFYNIQGFRSNGLSYLKHFFGPVAWLAPLMFIIELVSHLFRPLSLALRLRGNIYGDHIVLHIFTGMTHYGIPVIFYGMGLFVSLMQAFVFCLLTMVYISLSTAHDH